MGVCVYVYIYIYACVCVCVWAVPPGCGLQTLALPSSTHNLVLGSQHLPFESKHDVDHLQATGDLLQDTVLLPQLVELPVPLRAQVQGVPPPNLTFTYSPSVTQVCFTNITFFYRTTSEIQCLAKVLGPLELCNLFPHFSPQTKIFKKIFFFFVKNQQQVGHNHEVERHLLDISNFFNKSKTEKLGVQNYSAPLS